MAQTIQAGGWIGTSINAYASGQPDVVAAYYATKLGRQLSITRERGDFEGFSNGSSPTPLIKDMNRAKAWAALGIHLSLNLNWRFGNNPKTPITASSIANGNFDFGPSSRVTGRSEWSSLPQAVKDLYPGSASSMIYDRNDLTPTPGSNSLAPADCYSLYENGLDFLLLQAQYPDIILLIEHLSEANVDGAGAQPTVPDIVSNHQTDTTARRNLFRDAVLRPIKLWQAMGVNCVLNSISLGMSCYNGTAQHDAAAYWDAVIQAEIDDGKTYVPIVGVDGYSGGSFAVRNPSTQMYNTALAFAETNDKYVCIMELGCGAGGTTDTTKDDTIASGTNFFTRLKNLGKTEKAGNNRLWGIVYNLNDESAFDNYFEPESDSAAHKGVTTGSPYTRPGWLAFSDLYNDVDWAVGDPVLKPQDLVSSPTLTDYDWAMARLDGGGGINCVAWSDDGTTLLAGADNGGPKISEDGGLSWRNITSGLFDDTTFWVGGIDFKAGSTDHFGMLTHTGYWVSTDKGKTWNRPSNADVALSNNSATRPRYVGRLICHTGDYSYMVAGEGTGQGKVYRYKWSTGVFTLIAQPGGIGEAILVHPADPETLIVGTTTGMWKISAASGSATLTAYTGPGAPTSVKDLAMAITNPGGLVFLYALTLSGLKRLAGTAVGGTWADATANLPINRDWCSVDAIASGTGIRLVVGAGNGVVASGKVASHYTANNGDATDPATIAFVNRANDDVNMVLSQVDNGVGDGTTSKWWGYLAKGAGGDSPNAFVYGSYGNEQTLFNPANPNLVLIGGQQGCWLMDLNSKVVKPSLSGMGTTTNNTVVTNPNANEVFVLDRDQVCIGSVDNGVTWGKDEFGLAASQMGAALAFDEKASGRRMFMAASGRNPFGGQPQIAYATSLTAGAWQILSTPTTESYGIAVRRVGTGTAARVYVFLATNGNGIWRVVYTTADPPVVDTALAKVESVAMATAQTGTPGKTEVSIFWLDDSTVVLYDPRTGIWACKNPVAASPSWWKVWAISDAPTRGEDFACAGGDGDTVFVSVGSGTLKGVYKLTGFSSASSGDTVGSGITKTNVDKPSGTWQRPGPLDYNPTCDILAVMERAKTDDGTGHSGSVSRCYAVLGDPYTSLVEISSETAPINFTNLVNKEWSLAVGRDGRIWVSTLGAGTIVGVPNTTGKHTSVKISHKPTFAVTAHAVQGVEVEISEPAHFAVTDHKSATRQVSISHHPTFSVVAHTAHHVAQAIISAGARFVVHATKSIHRSLAISHAPRFVVNSYKVAHRSVTISETQHFSLGNVAVVGAESYFMPPLAIFKKTYPADAPGAIRSVRYRDAFASISVGQDITIPSVDDPDVRFTFLGGRWNGPLTTAEIAAVTAAGLADRLRKAVDASTLPGTID